MNRSFMPRMLMVAMLVSASLAFAGSAKGISGKYGNEFMEVEFKSSGKAYVTLMGGAMTEVNYEVEGDKIILRNQAGNIVLTHNKDGSLSGGPLNETLKKVN